MPKGTLPKTSKIPADSATHLYEIQLQYAFEYGIDFANRSITLTETIEFPMFDFVDAAMSRFELENDKDIKIKIHSMGGSVYDALGIVGRLKNSPCKIITEGYGCVMSAATIILACGDTRRMSEYGWFMHHESNYSVEGKHSEVKSFAEQIDKEEKQWAEAMAKFTKKDVDFWLNTGVGLDEYVYPEELLEYGVVDEIF